MRCSGGMLRVEAGGVSLIAYRRENNESMIDDVPETDYNRIEVMRHNWIDAMEMG